MLELYMIRHGLAGTCLEDKIKDEERPLKRKGEKQIKDLSKALKAEKILFDIVLTSPLIRSKESAEIINSICSHAKEAMVTDLLKPDASFYNLLKFLNTFKDSKRVAIVGHEPFLGGFASYCLSKNRRPFISLKKGGVLMLEIKEMIKPGQCLLAWLIEPGHIIQK